MKILIAVPTYENIAPETFKSIYNLEISDGCDVVFEFVRGYGAARARNLIGKKCLEGNFDAVFMVDSDIVLPKNSLELLIEGNTPIVLGTYPRKFEPEISEIFLPGSKDFVNRISYADMPNSRFKAKGGGMGCAFVRRECFEKLSYPWFDYVEYPNGQLLSEDNYFCDIAAKRGLKIEADGRVRCGHIAKQIV